VALSGARGERAAGDPNSTAGLTAFRAGAGEGIGAAFSPSACFPLPFFPLLARSTTGALLGPSLDFIGEGEVEFIDLG
jgi:hypothetical protein